MLNNATIQTAVEKLQHGKYKSTFNQGRTNSIFLGALIGLNNNLPLEHNRFTIDRFCYDVIDPAVNRLTISLGNKTDAVKPTIRTAAHTFIKNRIAIIFEPLTLTNPIQSLAWMLGSNDFSLFTDSILEKYKRLDISPYSVDLKYAFTKYAEQPDNLYNVITQGLVAKLSKTVRVGNTEVPRSIPSTDELAILAMPLIAIALGYTIPLPTCRVDDINSYIVSQHEGNIINQIDSINEKVIIDTSFVINATKHIYALRYLAMFETAVIAHNLVYMQLTDGTSDLPKELYKHFDDMLRDEVADDIRDTLVIGVSEETGGSNSSCYLECYTVTDFLTHYDNVFNYIAKSKVEYDSIVFDNIIEQMDQLERMSTVISEGNVERNMIALEDMYSSNYNKIPKDRTSVSAESYRRKLDNTLSYSVSVEAGMSSLGRALFGAIIRTIVAFIIRSIRNMLRSRKHTKDIVEAIKKNNDDIRKRIEEINKARKDEFGTHANKNLHAIFQIITKYNPNYKLPKLTESRDSAAEKQFIDNLCMPGKIEEIMTTRIDNRNVKQISATYTDVNTMKRISTDMEKLFLGNKIIIGLLNKLFDIEFISDIIKKDIYEQKLIASVDTINKEIQKIKPHMISVKETVMEKTVPVNNVNINKLSTLDHVLNFVNMNLSIELVGDEKDINRLNTLSKEVTKYIDDELKRGTLDESVSIFLNRCYKELSNSVIRELRFVYKAYDKINDDIDDINTYRKNYATLTNIINIHISGNK